MKGWLPFPTLGLAVILGCQCPPPAPKAYVELDHQVHARGPEGFAEVRIVPLQPGRDGISVALREVHHRYWQSLLPGSHGKPVTEFHALAYASREAFQRGESPVGRCARIGDSMALEIQVFIP